MAVRSTYAWAIGFLLLLLFIVLGEISVIFGEYVYVRLGIDRNWVLAILWIFPFVASFIASYLAVRFKLLLVITYIAILPLLAATAHWITESLGYVVDFRGTAGAIVIVKIYLFGGGVLLIAGGIVGVLASARSGKSDHDLSK